MEGPSHDNGGIPAYTPGQPPIELEGGEYIVNAATTAVLGTEFLDKLNRTQSPHHSEPGFNQGVLPGSNYKGGGYVKEMKHGGSNSKNTALTPLPESYRKSNRIGEACGNCIFVRGNYCKKWAFKIHREFWCKSWDDNKKTNVTKRGKR